MWEGQESTLSTFSEKWKKHNLLSENTDGGVLGKSQAAIRMLCRLKGSESF